MLMIFLHKSACLNLPLSGNDTSSLPDAQTKSLRGRYDFSLFLPPHIHPTGESIDFAFRVYLRSFSSPHLPCCHPGPSHTFSPQIPAIASCLLFLPGLAPQGCGQHSCMGALHTWSVLLFGAGLEILDKFILNLCFLSEI